MDSFEINKIIGAILVTVCWYLAWKITDVIFEVKKPDIAGYKVELNLNETSVSQASSETQLDVSAFVSAG